jgi:hypothetical protein
MTLAGLRFHTAFLGSAALLFGATIACSAGAAPERHSGASAGHGRHAAMAGGVGVHASAALHASRSETRTIDTVHRTNVNVNTVRRNVTERKVVYTGRRYVPGRRYGYGWNGSGATETVTVGTYANPTYSAAGGYGYVHHSCHWYDLNEPHAVPSRCYGYSYSSPSYAVSYDHISGGYRHGYVSAGSWRPWRKVVTSDQVHVTRTSRVATTVSQRRVTTPANPHASAAERRQEAVHSAASVHVAHAGGHEQHIKIH